MMGENRQSARASLRDGHVARVALRVAASLVYFQISRRLAAKSDVALDRALNDAALALAQIADVYYENDHGEVLRIPNEDLRAGVFEGGAKTFKTSNGASYASLSMRRLDVMYATEILEKAQHVSRVLPDSESRNNEPAMPPPVP